MDFTLEQLLARAAGNPAAEIVIEMLLIPDYPKWVGLINKAIDKSFRAMAENPELRKDRKEDELTIELVTLLKQLEIDARHEEKVGGHCDVTIRGPNGYAWLGEAKRHNRGLDWLFQGFQQLNTRYSTGLPEHSKGGMIIYTYSADLAGQMTEWGDYLAKNQDGLALSACPVNQLSFLSTHKHERSGLPYEIRHIPLSLYWNPKDKK
jgi:hypothetical protein